MWFVGPYLYSFEMGKYKLRLPWRYQHLLPIKSVEKPSQARWHRTIFIILHKWIYYFREYITFFISFTITHLLVYSPSEKVTCISAEIFEHTVVCLKVFNSWSVTPTAWLTFRNQRPAERESFNVPQHKEYGTSLTFGLYTWRLLNDRV